MDASKRRSDKGYTLLEVIVTIVIIGIITLVVTTAFPTIRTQQSLLRAERQIQSLVRDVQQRASNEIREDECLDQFNQIEDERRCSDVGLHIQNDQIILFSDTIDDDIFTSEDFRIDNQTLSVPTTIEQPTTFLFEATPPTTTLYINGAALPPNDTYPFILRSGSVQKNLLMYPYGQIEAE